MKLLFNFCMCYNLCFLLKDKNIQLNDLCGLRYNIILFNLFKSNFYNNNNLF